MIEQRPATVDEMVLAFLRAEIDTPTDRRQLFVDAFGQVAVERAQLIDDADLKSPQQNDARRRVLIYARGALFIGFPRDTAWRLVTVTPTEVKAFKYAKSAGSHPLLCSTRIVEDGVQNLDQVQNKDIKQFSDRVTNIVDRLRQGKRFPPLIAAQCTGIADVVLMEGHTRATAYALTDLPDEIEVFIGTSAHMRRWRFY
jgi:hypothetical protein